MRSSILSCPISTPSSPSEGVDTKSYNTHHDDLHVLELDLAPNLDQIVLCRPVRTGLVPVVVLVPDGAEAHQVHVILLEDVVAQDAVVAVRDVGE